MNEPDLPSNATAAEQIAFLRAAAARCRRLASATADLDLTGTLLAMAMDYDTKLQALIHSSEAARDEP
ncbi:hypothetical protein QO058_14300 [Bosea vestrisii]|uniref:hypothetical protein n=1 Tax=Bosea vestrisii TaxID=151416 RepID=UPI0024DFF43C|nr:hypothetical protein [Bosea vestrisii]WID98406.1 hypothetical protein QO058_09290 [Bosea vestrisii]WID99303.1 hypothetical protein QO058_14300 [Bosea vestrisii]